MDQYLIVRVQANSWELRQLQSQKAYSPQTALLLTLIARIFGIFQNYLQPDNSLKRLTVLSESSCIHGYGLLQQKDTDEYQSRAEAQRAQSGKQQTRSFHHPLPMESGDATFLAFCDNVHRVLPTMEAHLTVKGSEFLLGLHYIVQLIDCPHGCFLSPG